jgi:hypothetical protein
VKKRSVNCVEKLNSSLEISWREVDIIKGHEGRKVENFADVELEKGNK